MQARQLGDMARVHRRPHHLPRLLHLLRLQTAHHLGQAWGLYVPLASLILLSRCHRQPQLLALATKITLPAYRIMSPQLR